MGILSTIEDAMRGIFQGSVRRVMGSKIQEQEILDALRRVMDDHVRSGPGGQGENRRYAPSYYEVRINQSDYDSLNDNPPSVRELEHLRAQVCQQMGWNLEVVKLDQLTRLEPRVGFALNAIASRQGYYLQNALRVKFRPDPSFHRGGIDARVATPPDPQAAQAAAQPGAPDDGTRTMMSPQPDPGLAGMAPPPPPAVSIPPAWLTLYRPERGKPFLLDRVAVTIGRGEGNDIVINDARVSRAHAIIRFERGGFSVNDAGSHNGVYINGARVSGAAPLRNNDLISICGYEFIFQRR